MKIMNTGGSAPSMLAAAVYPEMAAYPMESAYVKADGSFDGEAYNAAYDAWRSAIRAQRDQPEGGANGMARFLKDSIRRFLGGDSGENRVYSPLNVYMALAMLAELTDGKSRGQVLSLLGADSVESVRGQAKALWNASYQDDGLVSSVLASSLWLNENVGFLQETLDVLAENYYASSYWGTMGSKAFDQLLQDWLNEQTGGLLKEQASAVRMDAQTLMAIATAVYFKAPWTDPFSENATEKDVFHAPGGDVTTDFMRKSSTQCYYWGEKFSAISLPLENDGAMWLLLPKEGTSPEELLGDGEAMEFLLFRRGNSGTEWSNQKRLTVYLSVPKFDVASDLNLIPGLKAMGVTDVFDHTVSDFTPMTGDVGEVCVSEAKHAARVKIDEAGCEAAAYTVLAIRAMALMPPAEEIDFILDRPFLFAVTGADGLPLFVGVVSTPTE